MPGLVPGIHVLMQERKEDVDGRDESGHDREDVTVCALARLRDARDQGRNP
jgi:hypothetical protein